MVRVIPDLSRSVTVCAVESLYHSPDSMRTASLSGRGGASIAGPCSETPRSLDCAPAQAQPSSPAGETQSACAATSLLSVQERPAMVRRWNVCRSRTGSLAHAIGMICVQAIRMPAPITRRGGSMAPIGAAPWPCPPTDRGYKCEAIADPNRPASLDGHLRALHIAEACGSNSAMILNCLTGPARQCASGIDQFRQCRMLP